MKFSKLAVLMFLGGTLAAGAAPHGTITSLAELRSLDNTVAADGIPVAFEATVTYFRGYQRTLFVQDGDNASFVLTNPGVAVAAGDRVQIKGKTQGSFSPIISADEVRVLHHGVLPPAIRANYDDLLSNRYDCKMVVVDAVVRSASIVLSTGVRTTSLRVLVDGESVVISIENDDSGALNGLLDSEVELTGVSGATFDGKMEQTGAMLYLASISQVKILKRNQTLESSLPITPMDHIAKFYRVEELSKRVRVRGTVTYYQPGDALAISNGNQSIWIKTQSMTPLRIDDIVDVTGMADIHDRFLTMTDGSVTDTLVHSPIQPKVLSFTDIAQSFHVFDLVSMEATVVNEIREPAQDEYFLVADGHQFSAVLHKALLGDASHSAQITKIPIGAKVSVVGVCVLQDPDPFNHLVQFNILMRSPADIAVVGMPSWFSARHLAYVIAGVLVLLFLFAFWAWTLKRRVVAQTSIIASKVEVEAALERRMMQLERRRSSILEAINRGDGLSEILGEIVDLLSFRLDAPCWGEFAGGVQLGDVPQNLAVLTVIPCEIAGHSGTALGTLHAGMRSTQPHGRTTLEALADGARLAALAIETRRIYSDLRHRSEFDQLTQVLNRFSLERHLGIYIEEANVTGSQFGLIYIDLDKFKEVNDNYGHHVGDLYLQEAARRMKQQLRNNDMLARLGGDEFVALVQARSRGEVEMVRGRIERCFEPPFELGETSLCGTASFGIACYPEDGSTKDALLTSADAAMYVFKRSKPERSIHAVIREDSEPLQP